MNRSPLSSSCIRGGDVWTRLCRKWDAEVAVCNFMCAAATALKLSKLGCCKRSMKLARWLEVEAFRGLGFRV